MIAFIAIVYHVMIVCAFFAANKFVQEKKKDKEEIHQKPIHVVGEEDHTEDIIKIEEKFDIIILISILVFCVYLCYEAIPICMSLSFVGC